jgi:hypothetical protein
VCKRIGRRKKSLGLEEFAAYGDSLERYPQEWAMLDSFCRIMISRLYRDRNVFGVLGERVLPRLAQRAEQEKRDVEARGMRVELDRLAALFRGSQNELKIDRVGGALAQQMASGMGEDVEIAIVHGAHDSLGLPGLRPSRTPT